MQALLFGTPYLNRSATLIHLHLLEPPFPETFLKLTIKSLSPLQWEGCSSLWWGVLSLEKYLDSDEFKLFICCLSIRAAGMPCLTRVNTPPLCSVGLSRRKMSKPLTKNLRFSWRWVSWMLMTMMLLSLRKVLVSFDGCHCATLMTVVSGDVRWPVALLRLPLGTRLTQPPVVEWAPLRLKARYRPRLAMVYGDDTISLSLSEV